MAGIYYPTSPIRIEAQPTVIHILALCVGAIAGLRIFLPLTALAWAGHFDWLILGGASSTLGWASLKWVLSALSIGETLYLLHVQAAVGVPLHRIPLHMLSGTIAGATIGKLAGVTAIGAIGGLVGAAIGFFLGISADKTLVALTGSARTAIVMLDMISLVALLFIVAAVS